MSERKAYPLHPERTIIKAVRLDVVEPNGKEYEVQANLKPDGMFLMALVQSEEPLPEWDPLVKANLHSTVMLSIMAAFEPTDGNLYYISPDLPSFSEAATKNQASYDSGYADGYRMALAQVSDGMLSTSAPPPPPTSIPEEAQSFTSEDNPPRTVEAPPRPTPGEFHG